MLPLVRLLKLVKAEINPTWLRLQRDNVGMPAQSPRGKGAEPKSNSCTIHFQKEYLLTSIALKEAPRALNDMVRPVIVWRVWARICIGFGRSVAWFSGPPERQSDSWSNYSHNSTASCADLVDKRACRLQARCLCIFPIQLSIIASVYSCSRSWLEISKNGKCHGQKKNPETTSPSCDNHNKSDM